MAESNRPTICQQCGGPVQAGDRFCGTCGAPVLAPPPQAEQIIPQPVAAARGSASHGSRLLLLAVVLGALTVLLVAGGALALVGLAAGGNLLGGTEQNPPSFGDNRGAAPSPPASTQDPSPSAEPTDQTGGYDATELTTTESASPLPTTPEPTTSIGSYGQSTEEMEADAEAAAGEYYRAVGVGDWGYTYDNLDSSTRSKFTRDEWFKKNEFLAGDGSAVYYIDSVNGVGDSGEPTVEVTVRLTFGDGSTSVRNTFFVYEDGSWKHRFSQEEYDALMPDLSYEEFVQAQQ